MVDSTNVMTIMHKASLQTVETSIFEPLLPYIGFMPKTMDQGTARVFEYPIFHQVKGNNCVNAHLYYLKFDMCSRDPAGRCTACPPDYYRSTLLDQCLPVAHGVRQSALAACTVPNCAECAADADTCSRCAAVPTPLFVFDNTCVPSAVSRFGPSAADLVPCRDVHCVDCSADSAVCLECDATLGYIQTEGRCVPMADLLATRRGVDRTTSRVQTCSDPQCLACVADYTQCTQCDATNGFVLDSQTSTCVDKVVGTNTPRILSVYDETNQTLSLRFMGPIAAAHLTDATFDVSLTDLVDFRSPLNCSANASAVAVRLAVVGDRFLVFAVATDRQIIDGSLTVGVAPGRQVQTAAGNPVLGFPVVQDQVRRLTVNTSTVGQVAEVAASVLNSAKLLLHVLLAATQTKSLGSPNYIFSQQSILALLGGPWVDLPDQILYNSIQYIQGVPPLPNPFVALHGDDETCDLPPRYARLEMHCSFTLNFGAPLLAIGLVAVLSAVVHWVHGRLTTQVARDTAVLARTLSTTATEGVTASDTTTAKSKAGGLSAQQRTHLRRSAAKLWWIHALKPFRFAFAVDYVESLLAEILLYSFLNLTRRPTDSVVRVGAVLSLASFAGVAVMVLVGVRVAGSVRRQCAAVDPHKDRASRTVDKVLDLDSVDGAAFAKRFADFAAPLSSAASLLPFAEYGRCFLFACVVIGLGFAPLVQIACMVCIQTLHMVAGVVWYGKKSQADKWVGLWIESQFLVYIILKLLVLLDSDSHRVQNLTGLIMAVVLVILQITAIILQSCGLILGLYELIKSRHQKSIGKTSQNEAITKASKIVDLSPNKTFMASKTGSTVKILDSGPDTPQIEQPVQTDLAKNKQAASDTEVISQIFIGDDQPILKSHGSKAQAKSNGLDAINLNKSNSVSMDNMPAPTGKEIDKPHDESNPQNEAKGAKCLAKTPE